MEHTRCMYAKTEMFGVLAGRILDASSSRLRQVMQRCVFGCSSKSSNYLPSKKQPGNCLLMNESNCGKFKPFLLSILCLIELKSDSPKASSCQNQKIGRAHV